MLYFLVYNDNTHSNDLNNLLNSVEKYGKEFKIIIFNKEEIDDNFYEKNKSILSLNRGGGYWLWKPYIINETLKKLKDEDILFYLDSKYFFTEDFTELYNSHLKTNDLLVFKNKPNESTNYMKNLCKMDVVLKYNIYDKLFIENVEEIWAGCIILKKSLKTVNLMKEWLDMCCIYEDITDSPSKVKNDDCFWDHRHDQALLSILLYKNNIEPKFFKKKYLQNVRIPY